MYTMQAHDDPNGADFWPFLEPEEPITPPGTDEQERSAKPEGESQQNIYHVYVVKEPATTPDTEHPIWQEEEEQEPEEAPHASRAPQHQRYRVLLPLVLAALLVVGLLVGTAVAYLTQATSAQVTLIPAQHAVTITTTLAVVTTGSGGGLLTFYNGLPVEQTISAGTLIISSTGVQVVTDEDAVIPAASLPVSGHVTVVAHSLIVGPEGNLPALSVSMPCCRENVYVQNASAFAGGQLARNFPSVTKHDIVAATDLLKASVQQSVQAAMQPQVRSGETLITPLPCQAKVSSDHAAGEEAAQVTVSLDDTCHGVVYQTQGMQQLLRQVLTQEVTHQLGTGYHLSSSGEVESQVLHVQQQDARGGTLSMQVRATGTGIYHFTAEQMQHLKHLITGKSKTEATRLLLEQTGVSTVSLEVKGRETETLPSETSSIALLVIVPAA